MTQCYYDFEPFLTALDKLGKDIPICGGYAHTYRNEDGIYVFTKMPSFPAVSFLSPFPVT